MDVKTAIQLLQQRDQDAELVVRGTVEQGYLDAPVEGIDEGENTVILDI